MSTQSDLTVALEALRSLGHEAWLVGGALRDRLLGRETLDHDVILRGDVPQAARAVARAARGHAFELSEGFGAWRIVSRASPRWQLDLLPLTEQSIEADLARRDFTVNALAQPLGAQELIDPFGGRADLAERRLRMVSASAFEQDPLRTLRLARLAGDLGFGAEPATTAQAARSATGLRSVAAERIFEEMKRIITAPDPLVGLRLMDEVGVTRVVLPELAALRGVEQSPYHHLDVYEHTLAVLGEVVALQRDAAERLGPAGAEVDALLSLPLANELTRWQALRLGALVHDIAKPQTRGVTEQGRVTFMGHDTAGAELAETILGRLRASERLCEHVARLVRHHLRLGFLVHEAPLSRRANYRYLEQCGPVAVDVTVLSVADRLATRGQRVGGEAIAKHVELAWQMLEEALRWQADPPRPPLRGDELSQALGLAPGPELGRILAALEEASYAREICSREEAIERARELLRHGGGSGKTT
jgi:poly(A) polymerase